MHVITSTAMVNGTSLYYEIVGEGEPVVLIHGLALDTRMWDDQFALFAERYRVIRYDLRGFGRSALPTGAEYSHADDLRALLDHVAAPYAHLVGLSMGGSVALQHAQLYPDATRSLVLVDSALGGYAWSKRCIASFDAIDRCAERAGPQAGNDMWLEHELFEPARERPGVRAKLKQIVSEHSGWIWLNESGARQLDPPSIERLNDVRMPALVIVGGRDMWDFRRIADILAAGIPNARYALMKGVGHMSNMEHPEEFNSIVLRFLSGTD